MTEVTLKIDNKFVQSFNDPSDVWDNLIVFRNLPTSLFTIRKDRGWSWNVLPFKFGWNGKLYEIKKRKI